jgi:hypothetical protein
VADQVQITSDRTFIDSPDRDVSLPREACPEADRTRNLVLPGFASELRRYFRTNLNRYNFGQACARHAIVVSRRVPAEAGTVRLDQPDMDTDRSQMWDRTLRGADLMGSSRPGSAQASNA